MAVFGILSSVFDFLTFFVLTFAFHYTNHYFQTGWFITSFATQILVVFIIRTKRVPFYKSKPAGALVFSVFALLGVALLAALTPVNKVFLFAKLPVTVLLCSLVFHIHMLLLMLLLVRFAH